MGYSELLNVCESLDVDMSKESAQLYNCFKNEVCLSHRCFVKPVCYTEAFCFTSKWTIWGCTHEKFAKNLEMKQTKLRI